MRPQTAELPPMTIDEFLDFCSGRPDDERWELIEGIPVMNASPVRTHQIICMNIGAWLRAEKIRRDSTWLPLLGVGTRVPLSPNSLPQPDVYVQESDDLEGSVTDDALVLFEVLSKSNTKSDRAWRQRVYASVPNCQHYVTVATKSVAVERFDRSTGWTRVEFKGLDATLDLPVLGVALPLSEVYRWTPLAA